jgi:hypothetical protein
MGIPALFTRVEGCLHVDGPITNAWHVHPTLRVAIPALPAVAVGYLEGNTVTKIVVRATLLTR